MAVLARVDFLLAFGARSIDVLVETPKLHNVLQPDKCKGEVSYGSITPTAFYQEIYTRY